MDGGSGHRAVEIDEVKPLAAFRLPAHGHRHGVVAVDGFPGQVALEEPNAATPSEIDRGEDDHDPFTRAAKFASRRRPTL